MVAQTPRKELLSGERISQPRLHAVNRRASRRRAAFPMPRADNKADEQGGTHVEVRQAIVCHQHAHR
jgi:hypothetical protein